MTIINSNDYHDYVIKDGKLIGEFDQMYKNSKDIPWHQDKQEDKLDIRLDLELLKEYSPFDYICDLGCGLGYFLDQMKRILGAEKTRLVGYDISRTCCEKGKVLFPHIDFCELDLMAIDHVISEKNRMDHYPQEKRLFVFRGTLWYVFPNMENVVANISNMTFEKDLLLISQNFPPLDGDFVGKEVIPNPDAILYWFKNHFNPLKTIWLEDKIQKSNDNWFVCLFERI
jgi:SAM-dependent methyltransferase